MIIYSYTYDESTGGLLLNSTPTGFSKEPRPVYAPEMDVLGFDKYWSYDKQTAFPYMWAEANNYYYRGRPVAKLSGGDVYTAPEIIIPSDESGAPIMPEPEGVSLRTVDIDAMVEANRDLLETIEETTVKKILDVYNKYNGKLDCFHVAFSGGKDSCVLLDLVKKALPQGSFMVLFADTGMEFPDTYDVIQSTKRQCEKEGIPFHVAKSHLDPKDSWKMFGPPSRTLRWCCSVHKSAPQTLKLREYVGKSNYTGLAFVGIRSHESATRAGYDYLNDSKKIRGQFSHNSILDWTSAEVWLYMYANNLIINEAYRKGNSRAGCILCPMSVKKADYIKRQVYRSVLDEYVELIKRPNGRNFDKETYISNGGWVSRRSGRDLIGNVMNYSEKTSGGVLTISVSSPKTDWREWIKTLDCFGIMPLTVKNETSGYTVEIPVSFVRENPVLGKLLKQVFRKAAYCVKCGVCQSNCSFGHLALGNGLQISGCEHCLRCHDIDGGCHAYNSLRIPLEEKAMSINCFDSVLPKADWFSRFFAEKNAFWLDHGLGPNQVKTFKRFLRDSALTEKNTFSSFARRIEKLGWETETSWGLMLINLVAANPQISWYVANLDIGKIYSRDTIISMLLECNNSMNVVKFVYSAFGKLTELPLGKRLHFGFVTEEGDLVRTKCSVSDPRVVLYGLFKFAEKCGDYKEFTLATLLNDSIDRDGISPTRIFGLEREEMVPMLLGLSAKYPEFISASFTHDLEKIALSEYMSSQDVLDLFKGDNQDG